MSSAATTDLDQFVLSLGRTPKERRGPRRFRFAPPIDALMGRHHASLVDVSASGARVRHTIQLPPHSLSRLRFKCDGATFDIAVRVLASRYITIGVHRPLYESRLRFSDPPATALARVLDILLARREEAWMNNVSGAGTSAAHAGPAGKHPRFTCCRFLGGRWTIESRSTCDIPADGFIVPSHIDEGEVRVICLAYERLDAGGRQLLRLFAAADCRS